MSRILTEDGSKNLSGNRLRELRRAKGLSQEELMIALQNRGMDSERGVIKRMENGNRAITDIELKILAEYFHVSYQYLIDGAEENEEPPDI